MNMHTPGPWTVRPFLTPDKDDDPMMVYLVEAGDLQQRFDNLETNEDGEFDFDVVDSLHAENNANARLIAAAPQLLEALRFAYMVLETMPDEGKQYIPGNALGTIKTAIAQAEGKD
jgi:hypothetical protein